MILPSQRHLFDIPEHVSYLNCAYMSPSLKSVREAGMGGVAVKSAPWTLQPYDFFDQPERARTLFARLIHCDPGDVAIIPAASYGLTLAARSMRPKAGQDIVVLEGAFPSNVLPWRQLARDTGARLVTVPRSDTGTWADGLLEAIGPDTAIAALPQCHWTDGSWIDLETVAPVLRSHGAALVLDLSQSLGAVPLDVQVIQPDFVAAPCYKWLLGPYSLGFAYVAPRWQYARPLEETWITRQGAEDFNSLAGDREDFAPGARRFDMGERAQFHLMPMAIAAMEQLLAWGSGTITDSLREKTSAISEAAEALGLDPGKTDCRAPHFAGLRFPGGMPENLAAALRERHIYVSVRGDSLRVTPHLYNSDSDIARLFEALRTLL